MSFFNKHHHEFERDGRRMWCKCGAVRILPCNHIWRIHDKQGIEVTRPGGGDSGKQEVQTLICVNCGTIVHLNTITGQKEVIIGEGS